MNVSNSKKVEYGDLEDERAKWCQYVRSKNLGCRINGWRPFGPAISIPYNSIGPYHPNSFRP